MIGASMTKPDPLDEPLTRAEIQALLWCVRNVGTEALRTGPYRPQPGVFSHGALSTAANKIERAWEGAPS